MPQKRDGKSREGIESEVTGRTECDVTILDVATRETLAMRTIPDKKGEPTTAREMFIKVGKSLPGGVVTADAAYASPDFIAAVTSAGHEYIIGLKGNPGEVFVLCAGLDWGSARTICETEDVDHGRHERRSLKRIALGWGSARAFSKYAKFGYLFCVESERTQRDSRSLDSRYFIGSSGLKGMSSEDMARIIRDHWAIENGLHWVKAAVLG